MQEAFDVWVGGYPRSANTFVTAAFKLGNPSVKVATHWHIPAFIINAVRRKRPGFFMIRNPIDCIVSWTIYWEGRIQLEDALNYYLDFHSSLLPYHQELFIASFQEAVEHFPTLLQRFNKHFATSYVALPASKAFSDQCTSRVEDFFRAPDGSINEFSVPRPSAKRADCKHALVAELSASPRLERKLAEADELWKIYSTRASEAESCHFGQTIAFGVQEQKS